MESHADPSLEPARESIREDGTSRRPSRLQLGLSSLRRIDKVLGGCAVLLLVSGLLIRGYGAIRDAGSSGEPVRLVAENGPSGGGQTTLRPGGALVDGRSPGVEPGIGSPAPSTPPSGEASAGDGLVDTWSPAMIRGGFGFLVGFSVGLVLRLFLRVSLVVVGLNLLMLFFFSYIGWLDVRWDVIEVQSSEWMASLEEQLSHFQTFIAGSLPTAGLSGVGLLTGFRRH